MKASGVTSTLHALIAIGLVACGSPARPSKPFAAPPAPVIAKPTVPFSITYVANNGVLIEAGTRKILIDGLHRFYGEAYAVLPDKERAIAELAGGRFADVNIIIATHEHGDHFSAEAVAAHLSYNKARPRFYGPPQVVAALKAKTPAGIHQQIEEIAWAPGESQRFHERGVDIELLGLRHTYPKKHEQVHNLGVLVRVAGITLLHVGDADATHANFAPFSLPKIGVDFALLPSWFVGSEESRKIVADSIAPRRVVALHIDPRKAEAIAARLRAAMPSLLAGTKMMQRWSWQELSRF
jgi:L-ascorbate metabolism protein UlaG (beta-lactamase superfamily)